MKSLIPTLGLLLLLASPAHAAATIPDFDNCYATSNAGSILITLPGSGPTLASEGLTVTAVLIDPAGYPIPGYPFNDIWLDDELSGDLVMCHPGGVGSAADANTNADGETTFSGALAGGGFTQGGLRVYVAGVPIGTEPLPIDVVSPDIEPDLLVNLRDLAAIATDYDNGVYDFRSDLSRDGIEDLRDIGIFAAHYDEMCP